MRNLPKFSIYIIFFILLIVDAFLILTFFYKDYSLEPENKNITSYLKKEITRKYVPYCLYETRTVDGEEIPLRVDGDVEFIDNQTLIVRNPEGCSKEFTYNVKAGKEGDPMTRVISLNNTLTQEEKDKKVEAGIEFSAPFYIGDREMRDRGENEKSIKDRGAFYDLFGSGKQFSTKSAYVVFNWSDEVYFLDDYIYINQIFFNEK